jgi:hypothetical protein
MTADKLFTITLTTDFMSMAFSLWFALYLMVRSRSSKITFRAVVAFVSLSFYYGCAIITTLNPDFLTASYRALSNILTLTATQHLTHYLLPDHRQPKHRWISRVILILAVSSVMVILISPVPTDCDIRYICSGGTVFASFFPDILEFLIFLAIVYNLWWIFRSELRLKTRAFYFAVLIGSSVIGYGFVGKLLDQPLPRFVATTLVLVALTLFGYSVTRYQALVEQRITSRDYPISLLTITCLLGIYIPVTFMLGLSLTKILWVTILVILTHAIADYVRDYLDHIQQKQDREIRFRLRELGRKTPAQISLKRLLTNALSILCHNLEAQDGFIAVREGDSYIVYATFNAIPVGTTFPMQQMESDQVFQPDGYLFGQTHWIVPAYGGSKQVAAIGIGARAEMKEYTETDSFWIEDVADQIGALVIECLQAAESADSVMPEEGKYLGVQKPETEELLSILATRSDPKVESIVEDGFRHFHDYSKLARSPLVGMLGIQAQSHIDAGKQVQQELLNILEQLRPAGNEPPEPVSREWYCYTILRDAYIEDIPTRDIMSKLYISEGTYYRTRRRALRMVSREIMGVGSIA